MLPALKKYNPIQPTTTQSEIHSWNYLCPCALSHRQPYASLLLAAVSMSIESIAPSVNQKVFRRLSIAILRSNRHRARFENAGLTWTSPQCSAMFIGKNDDQPVDGMRQTIFKKTNREHQNATCTWPCFLITIRTTQIWCRLDVLSQCEKLSKGQRGCFLRIQRKTRRPAMVSDSRP